MARISDNVLPEGAQLGLTLDRYQELMGLDCCAFNGINHPTEIDGSSCPEIVTQSQRDEMARYLLQAEERRERELSFFVAPKWITEEVEFSGYNPFILSHKHLIVVGAPAATLIEAGVAINYGIPPFNEANEPTDPVPITVTSGISTSEIMVVIPGGDVNDAGDRINPTRIFSAAGIITIQIPRCRLVRDEYLDDRHDPPIYYDVDVFFDTVDVYRYYADVSQGAQFVWAAGSCGDTDCTPNCQLACTTVIGEGAYRLSIVHAYPATYSNGIWTKGCFTYCQSPNSARFVYKSGIQSTIDIELTTIRLAHTLMPRSPCSCDLVKQRWTEDRVVDPNVRTAYGNMSGAIDAWVADGHMHVGHGGMFPGMRG